MYKLIEIIKKNFRLLIRSKTSALIVLVGPLLLMLFVGMAFNTSSLFDIKIGTYSSGYNELSESLITQLEDDEYRVIKLESEESCIISVQNQEVQICAIIPENLAVQGEGSIVFHVDKSRMNLVGSIIQSISSKVSVKSSELSTALTNSLLSTVTQVQDQLLSKEGSVTSISSNMQSIKDALDGINSDLTNLDVSKGNFSDFDDESANYSTDNNLTGDDSEAYDDIIGLAKEKFEAASNKLNAVGAFRTKALTDLQSIQETLTSQKATGDELNSAVQSIKGNVEAIEITDVSKIVSPLSIEIKPVAGETTHLSSTFPTLLVLVLLFSGVFIASTMVIEEKSSKAFFRNFITPTGDISFLVGDFLFNLIILLFQLGIIFIVMLNIVSINFTDAMVTNLIILLILLSSIFILLGMLIGYLFNSEETSNLAAISISGVLLFFSNTILPLETLPVGIKNIVEFSPFVVGELALKRILLFGQGLGSLASSFYVLIGYVIVFAGLVYLVRELTKRKPL